MLYIKSFIGVSWYTCKILFCVVLFLYSIVPEYLNPRWPKDAILRVILKVPLWVFLCADLESYYGVILHFDFPKYFKIKMAIRLQHEKSEHFN